MNDALTWIEELLRKALQPVASQPSHIMSPLRLVNRSRPPGAGGKIIRPGPWKLTAAVIFCSLVLAVVLISVLFWIIKKKVSKQRSEPDERPDNQEQFFTDHVYSNVGMAQARRHPEKKEEGEMVEYAAVEFNGTRRVAPRCSNRPIGVGRTVELTAIVANQNGSGAGLKGDPVYSRAGPALEWAAVAKQLTVVAFIVLLAQTTLREAAEEENSDLH
ncbi:hypothetical protein INR49_001854 [Caranx melampygus]|nr:hypothetical protein INR49_001854 [Caranx melampygus]